MTHKSTVNVINSGVATGGVQGGQSATRTAKNFPKIGKRGKKSEKSGKKRKNREEKAKIGKFFHFGTQVCLRTEQSVKQKNKLCPSWQTGLATLLVIKQLLSNLLLISKL